MEAFGAKFAEQLRPPQVIYLRGELGTGKTTFVRGALRGLGYQGHVKSPTFTIVESYSVAGLDIHHFDLYRISDPEELEFIGIRDYATDTSIEFFEWPDLGKSAIPAPTVAIEFNYHGKQRSVQIEKYVAL